METLPGIIGVAGTNASLKGTLAARRQATQFTRTAELSDILRIEVTNRGLSHERENLRTISTEWGRKFGAGALATMTLNRYQEERLETDTGISIVSVRRPAEARAIQDAGGAIVWLDADAELRYERVAGGNRGRIDDQKTLEEFIAEEAVEMNPSSDDPFLVNMSGVREIADFHVDTSFAGVDAETGTVLSHGYLTREFGI